MTTVGLIGSGHIGGTVARLSVAAGYAVVLSNSRGPQTLTELVAGLGPLARAAASEQAASEGDLVVVTIPLRTYQSVPAAPLAGKLVLDTCNYYPQRGRLRRPWPRQCRRPAGPPGDGWSAAADSAGAGH